MAGASAVQAAAPPPYDCYIVPDEDTPDPPATDWLEWDRSDLDPNDPHYELVDEHDGTSGGASTDHITTTSTSSESDEYGISVCTCCTWDPDDSVNDIYEEEYGIVVGKALGPSEAADVELDYYNGSSWTNVLDTLFPAHPAPAWYTKTTSDLGLDWDEDDWNSKVILLSGYCTRPCGRINVDEVHFGLWDDPS
jgi:hypothetical protein